MPEGPEVKLMMDKLRETVLNYDLITVRVNTSFVKKTKDIDSLVLPKKIVDADSKGKFGYMLLNDGSAIGFVFAMSGELRYDKADYKVEFGVRDGDGQDKFFYFCCTRNFEWVMYLTDKQLKSKLSALGPSIFTEISKEMVVARWRKYNTRTVCEALMEQKLISGIGNYIKSEILYTCGIYPLAKIKDITDDNLYALYRAAKILAEESYTYGASYVGEKTFLKVYNRSRDPAGHRVEKLDTPDKRTTHWVSTIQTIGKPRL